MVARKSAAKPASSIPAGDNSFANFLAELAALADKYAGTVKAPQSGVDTKPAPATKDDAADDAPAYTEAELKKKTIAALRKILTGMEIFNPEDIADADKETLIDAILNPEGSDSDDEDDEDEADDADDSDDDDDDGDDDADRATLDDMSLRELKAYAKDQGVSAAEIKGLDREELTELLLDSDGDDDDDSDVDVDDDDAEDGDAYTEDELEGMETADLIEIAEEWELDLPKRKTKAALIKLILDAQEEVEDEDEDDDDE